MSLGVTCKFFDVDDETAVMAFSVVRPNPALIPNPSPYPQAAPATHDLDSPSLFHLAHVTLYPHGGLFFFMWGWVSVRQTDTLLLVPANPYIHPPYTSP